MRVSVQVFDVVHGRPARDVRVGLDVCDGTAAWRRVGEGCTDRDGRVDRLGAPPGPGEYRLVVDAGRFFAAFGLTCAQRSVVVTFDVERDGTTRHIPILLAPYGFATYTGVRS